MRLNKNSIFNTKNSLSVVVTKTFLISIAISLTNTVNAETPNPTQTSQESRSDQVPLTERLLGSSTIKESRGESGRVYRIDLEHSSGSKQVIKANDLNGQIRANENDLQDTPPISKWTLGSW